MGARARIARGASGFARVASRGERDVGGVRDSSARRCGARGGADGGGDACGGGVRRRRARGAATLAVADARWPGEAGAECKRRGRQGIGTCGWDRSSKSAQSSRRTSARRESTAGASGAACGVGAARFWKASRIRRICSVSLRRETARAKLAEQIDAAVGARRCRAIQVQHQRGQHDRMIGQIRLRWRGPERAMLRTMGCSASVAPRDFRCARRIGITYSSNPISSIST